MSSEIKIIMLHNGFFFFRALICSITWKDPNGAVNNLTSLTEARGRC